MRIEPRVAALEKAMGTGGHWHLVIALDRDEADRKTAIIRKRDPNATYILRIIGSGKTDREDGK